MACEQNRLRLFCMLLLTFLFFVVEVVVSRITSSLAMLSDSFHMLSDVIALVVALIAVRFAEKTQATSKNTFGWIRAEVMGALVNAVFLTALCFTIVLEAIERFSEPQEIEKPLVVIGVGAVGLLVNLFGLCMFHGSSGSGGGGGGHGHSHGGGHSHHGPKKKKTHPKVERSPGKDPESEKEETNNLVGTCGCPTELKHNGPERHDLLKEGCTEVQINGALMHGDLSLDLAETEDSSSQLNMRGVFLHVLGDALGSVIVVVNATVFYFVWNPCPLNGDCINPCLHNHCEDQVNITSGGLSENSTPELGIAQAGPCWVLFLDPTLCIIMVCILLYTTYPLLKESALILLQTVPKQIDIRALTGKLRSLEGVLAVHELHVWQLAGSRIIATAHIKCRDPASYMEVAKRIKDFFHNEGIHATTIQPEFAKVDSESRISLCELPCKTQCALKQCCGSTEKANPEKTDLEKSEKLTSVIPCLEIINESPENKTKRTLKEKSQNNTDIVVMDADTGADKQFESSL
ncbi:zinc transporter 1a [Latimeria chalumnae]|uniref:Solute carrier family 30 member 1 n=1 Tax=Latimeria chalumnae TaxID=7897 RepID=H3AV21_LATCH|nr:PREDICTED: zinc transporter 1 [Latimeria chalumnae]|eukprot:XP_006002477.1 PREDICTED: zinc transporter 1 [Latimeria chalumnae]